MWTVILNCGLVCSSCTDQVSNPVGPVTPDEPETPERVVQDLTTPESQMERLARGVVALSQERGIFVSWRLLGTDDARTTFDVIRDGETIANGLTASNYADEYGTVSSKYQVVCKVNGVVVETSEVVSPWAENYMKLSLDRPATGVLGGEYSPNDCSVGDVDGDGEYEIFVKWDPSNSKDNSQSDKTDNVYLDCYKIANGQSSNCQLLWRIDLGVNIRAGAHYTQFLVYDFDGDGRAELMCKTAPGSKDGQGNYVNQAATDEQIRFADNTMDWRTAAGRINGGQEYLTVFNGQTGSAIHTIAYYPNRNALAELSEAEGSFNWDDRSGKKDRGDYGNRGERYLAAVAYLSGAGARPSGIFCRGYYTYAYVWAVDFDGTQLKHRWLHRSDSQTQYSVVGADMIESAKVTAPASTSGMGSRTMYGNGNHNMSVADADGDGRDEIIWGSAALDDDGKLLYATGFGHGDAIHVGKFNPDRKGLQVFQVHEGSSLPYGWDLHDAATGEILYSSAGSKDNGRGLCADLVAESRGAEFWSSNDRSLRSCITGEVASSKSVSVNFRIYWMGTAQDDLLDGTTLSQWNGNGTSTVLSLGNYNGSQSCNSTKATPCLQADIFGDWREEVIFWSKTDNATLNVFTTTQPTTLRVPTLMHDHTYRMGVAWQNTAYNQPPHLGFYLPDFVRSEK